MIRERDKLVATNLHFFNATQHNEPCFVGHQNRNESEFSVKLFKQQAYIITLQLGIQPSYHFTQIICVTRPTV